MILMKQIKEITNYNTDFYKKVISDLKGIGIKNPIPSEIAFMSENTSEEVSIIYKYMSTGLHYDKKECDEQDVISAGFKWWPTWNFYEK